MGLRHKDLTGTQHVYVRAGAFATTDDGEFRTVFVAPFDCEVLSVKVSFGTADVGADTNSANLFAYYGGSASGDQLGSVNLDAAGAVGFGEFGTVYSGTTDVAQGSAIWLQYATVGTGLAVPDAFVDIEYRGGSTRVQGTVMP